MSPKQKRPTIPPRKQASKGLNSDKECASLLQEALPFHQKGRLQEAQEIYQKILSLNPKYFDALHYLAVLEGQSGDYVKAFALFDEAIKLNAKNAALFNNRGNLLNEFKRHEDALASYEQAIRLKPEYAEAFNNRGNALNELKRYDEALASCAEAIRLKPDLAEAFHNRGAVLKELKRHEEAIASYEQAIRLKPDYEFVQGFVAFLSNRICHWAALEVSIAKIADSLSAGIAISGPFPLLSLIDAPELHKKASRLWVQNKAQPSGLLGAIPAAKHKEKIHLAYLSADFHEHATSYLMAELFELHDRGQFELTAISFGPPTDKPIGDRLKAAFDRFIDVRQRSDLDVARLCREMGVDIAVDLKGYTQDSRQEILAERCAPVQINWLGYPGTMAAPFIDYLVADPTLITQDDLEHYSEKVIWLPDTYQVNDRTRKISDKVFTRAECGLPEKGFVFCCFNNNYKILPATFAIWMRLLERVPGSVLWLFEDNPTASKNLRQEAQARGVDPSRLVFAPRWPLAEHLARHRLADLFIDTWPYNAHTTASDALWAGLPLVTRSGKSFASRVAASLLKAVALEELITDSDDAYEALAIKLAQHPQDLQVVKEKLAANRLTHPLFDSERFTRHLEQAYVQVMQRHWAGQDPEHLKIDADEPRAANATNTVTSDSQIEPVEHPTMNRIPPAPLPLRPNSFEHLLGLQTRLEVLDIGASWINEVPKYKSLVDRGIAHLHAVEGDERQIEKIKEVYGAKATVHPVFLFDGERQTVHLTHEGTGMTSVLAPNTQALKFFNGFEQFGQVIKTIEAETQRLDDIQAIPAVDFLKMDVQGAELTVLKHGETTLKDCVAIQLEVSFIALYESQPTFGEIDLWMRSKGFVPHCFVDIKRWSIAPTIRDNNFRVPFNQLLEADVVYIKDPLNLSQWSDEQLRKLALMAHECFASPDLTIHLLLELERRSMAQGQPTQLKDRYVAALNAPKEK